jgi:hypothetical protein
MEGIQMRNSLMLATLLLAAPFEAPIYAQAAMPLLTAVEPASGSYGDVFTGTGQNLDQETVAALFLTDGKNDVKVVITEQTATSIKFHIPVGMPKGRFALMILTRGKDARFIEEPVKITIESPTPRPTS